MSRRRYPKEGEKRRARMRRRRIWREGRRTEMKEGEAAGKMGTAKVARAAVEAAGQQGAAGMAAMETRAGPRRKRAIIASRRGKVRENSQKAAVGGGLKTKL